MPNIDFIDYCDIFLGYSMTRFAILRNTRTNRLTITTVAPVGVPRAYDATSPITKLITDKIAPAIVTLLKLLKIVCAERVGKIIRLDMSSAPTSLMPNTIRTEQRIAKIAL